MLSFEVKDMTCGHCAGAITRAVNAVDAGARVGIDLATKRAHIESAEADAAELLEAIQKAGYSPVAIQ